MIKSEIIEWVKMEFQPIDLATTDETISQIVDNAMRYWNTHSALPVVRMFEASAATIRIQLTPDYKSVVKVYPSTTPDWVLQNYPLWSLLGITIIDNLTSDLVMLSEAYRNYKYYMGTDFTWHYEKSDNPGIGGTLFVVNIPTPTLGVCVVGTKRLINGQVTVNIQNLSGTLTFAPVIANTLILTNGTHTYTDDGEGGLVSSLSGYSGTINYTTGAWSITGWSGSILGTATYMYYEDIKSEYILQWLLYYVKALVKMVEGNALRKTMAIDIKNDGQVLYQEGQTEKLELEKKLAEEGRWLTFVRRF
jgi:hypothetical protein